MKLFAKPTPTEIAHDKYNAFELTTKSILDECFVQILTMSDNGLTQSTKLNPYQVILNLVSDQYIRDYAYTTGVQKMGMKHNEAMEYAKEQLAASYGLTKEQLEPKKSSVH